MFLTRENPQNQRSMIFLIQMLPGVIVAVGIILMWLWLGGGPRVGLQERLPGADIRVQTMSSVARVALRGVDARLCPASSAS